MSVLVKGEKVYLNKYHLQLPMLAMEWISRFEVSCTIEDDDDGYNYYFVLHLKKAGHRSEALAHSMAADLKKQI